MRSIVFTFFIVLVFFPLHSQSWISSNNIIGGGDISEISSSATSDGGVVILGQFKGTIKGGNISVEAIGGRDYFLAKFDADLEMEWLKSLGSPMNTYRAADMGVYSNGFIYITGSFKDYLKFTPNDSIFSNGQFDIFLTKFDMNGNAIWCKNIGTGAGNQKSTNLEIDNFGDLLISGVFTDSIEIDTSNTLYSNNVVDDGFYGKFDALDGAPIWIKQIKGIDNIANILCSVSQNRAYIFGFVYYDSIQVANDTLVSQANSSDFALFKTDIDGNVDWIRTISGSGLEISYSITSDSSDNVYVGGNYNSASLVIQSSENETTSLDQNAGADDIFLAKYTSDGILDWAKAYGGIANDRVFYMTYYNDEIYACGLFADEITLNELILSTNGGIMDQDIIYFVFDLNGNIRSGISINGRNNSTEEGRAIFPSGAELTIVYTTTSDLIVLGDVIYTNPSNNNFIAIGKIGCPPFNIDVTTKDCDCNGDSTGRITVYASGGFGPPYIYFIDEVGIYHTPNPYFTNLPAGNYFITVTDQESCTEEIGPIPIFEPDELTIRSTESTDALCYGLCDGTITMDVTGETMPYQCSLDSGNTFISSNDDGTIFFTGLDIGEYYLAVKDINGCDSIMGDTVTISEPELLTLTHEIIYDFNSYSYNLVATATGGTVPYSYFLIPDCGIQDPEGTFTLFDGLEHIDYLAVEVDDVNNCGPVTDIIINDVESISIPQGKIYPNPTNSIFTLDLSTSIQGELEIHNIKGLLIYSTPISSTLEQIDMSSYAKGIYFVTVKSDAWVRTEKVVRY